MFLVMVFIFFTIGIILYYYLIRNYNYWKARTVPGPKPSLIFGNTKESTLLQTTIAEKLKDIYDQHDGLPYVGIFELRTPALLLRDPNLIKLILVKDFHYFQGRGIVMNENEDPLCANLINLTGPRWRMLRSKLTPAFTSGKLRNMFQLIAESSIEFKKFAAEYANTRETIEFRDFAAKFTSQVISSCCFGIETNSIQKHDSEFRKMCRRVLDPSLKISLRRMIRWYLPGIFKFFGMSLIPREVSAYFLNLVNNIIEYRETNRYTRHDFMQLLMQLKKDKQINNDDNEDDKIEDVNDTYDKNDHLYNNNSKHDIVIDDKIIAAQAFIFFLAGFETSSTTISFTMYELAVHREIQHKVHEEIKEKIEKYGKICYEAINEMEYLDRVIRETLRKHPPVGVVPRVCNKDYHVPGTNLIIEKGLKVLIPIQAIHHDPKYYPNPQSFNPDRFLESNKKSRDHCIFLPFGEGPRICIGMKFAYTQTKAGLVALLLNYDVSLADEMITELKYDPTANILTNKMGILLKLGWRKETNILIN